MIEKIDGRGPYLTKIGHNAATNTSEETLSPRSALITIQPAATAVQVSSSNANDTAAGTGAKTVRVFGLDVNFGRIYEDFSMNGQTAVTGSKVFSRVNHFMVLTVGSGGVNAGELIVSKTGAALAAGVPTTATDVISSILAGANIDWQAVYTVPLSERFALRQLHITNRSQIDYVLIKVRPYGGIFYTAFRYELSATAEPISLQFPRGALVLNEKEDLVANVVAGTAGGFCQAVFIFENTSYLGPKVEP